MKDIRAKILWVDDEINQLKPHILFLEEKGYVVSTSNNGQDALNELTKNNYDLVLLDQFMFGLDGIETLKLIKEKDPSEMGFDSFTTFAQKADELDLSSLMMHKLQL